MNDHARNEIAAVLKLMDDHAAVWGQEGVHRRCRDRLRKLLTPEPDPRAEFDEFSPAFPDLKTGRLAITHVDPAVELCPVELGEAGA